MPRIQLISLSASLLAIASLVACGEDSGPLAPEPFTAAEPMDAPAPSLVPAHASGAADAQGLNA